MAHQIRAVQRHNLSLCTVAYERRKSRFVASHLNFQALVQPHFLKEVAMMQSEEISVNGQDMYLVWGPRSRLDSAEIRQLVEAMETGSEVDAWSAMEGLVIGGQCLNCPRLNVYRRRCLHIWHLEP